VRGFVHQEVISGTLPIILKLFTNVKFACPFCRDVAKLDCVTPVAWYLTPVVSPAPLMPVAEMHVTTYVLPLIVNVIRT